jgi:hypothetical protein
MSALPEHSPEHIQAFIHRWQGVTALYVSGQTSAVEFDCR